MALPCLPLLSAAFSYFTLTRFADPVRIYRRVDTAYRPKCILDYIFHQSFPAIIPPLTQLYLCRPSTQAMKSCTYFPYLVRLPPNSQPIVYQSILISFSMQLVYIVNIIFHIICHADHPTYTAPEGRSRDMSVDVLLRNLMGALTGDNTCTIGPHDHCQILISLSPSRI